MLLQWQEDGRLCWAQLCHGQGVMQDEVTVNPWSESSKLQGLQPRGSVSRASRARLQEQLQIIFMGDNKNVLPHNQH